MGIHGRIGDTGIASPAMTALLSGERTFVYPPRQIIFREGEGAEHVYFIRSGVARLYRFFPNGRRLVTHFVFESDVVGFVADQVFPYSAEAIQPVVLQKVRRTKLDMGCDQSPDLQRSVAAYIRREFAALEDVLELRHCGADARFARLLLYLARKADIAIERDAIIPPSNVEDRYRRLPRHQRRNVVPDLS